MLQPPEMRRALRIAAALLLAGARALASDPASAAATAPTAEEIAAAALPEPRAWELTGNLRTAFGYKENVLLSAVRSESSAFAQAEAEVFWWRLPTERFEAIAFANGALTRFFDSEENPREWQAFAHAEARWCPAAALQATGVVEGYYLDQVFDLSESDAERFTERLAMRGMLTTAALRWNFWRNMWMELKPGVQRDVYRDGSDDNRQQTGRATIGRSFAGGRVEVFLAGQALRRDYERRVQYTAAGRPLVGTELEFRQREGELRIDVAWSEGKRWSTSTSASIMTNDDNGSGYFDYRHRAIRQEVTWTRAPWKARLTGRAGRFDYDVQTEGIGINPPKRLKEEFLGRLRIEREWRKRAVLYADWQWERSRSNDLLASYRVKTAALGVDWSF